MTERNSSNVLVPFEFTFQVTSIILQYSLTLALLVRL